MNEKKIAFGIGIVLTTLAVFTASAMAAPNTAYFVPQHSNAGLGETIYVEVWLNITDLHGSESLYSFVGADVNITYDSSIGEITAASRIDGDPWDGSWLSNHWYDPDNWWFTFYSTAWGADPPYGLGPGLWPVANLTIEGVTPGTMDLHFSLLNNPPSLRNCNMFDAIGNDHPNQLWIDGTFTCGTPYTISGYTFKNDGVTPENNAAVKVINLNNSKNWDATTSPGDNTYELSVYSGADVNATEILRLIAKEGVEWVNVTDHVVTQAQINAGGVSNVNLILDEFYLDLNEFPMYEAEEVGVPADHNKGCGPAVAKMWLDYMHNSTTQWNDTHFGDMPAKDQTQLYDWGTGNNSDTGLAYYDALGMWYTVQYLDPEPYSEYGYNFGLNYNADRDTMLKRICQWIAYPAGKKAGHPVNVPGAVPAYGDYTNWMAVRGIHTNEDAYPLPPTLVVYGFWVNDPYPASLGGIGENSYKTASEWTNTYYKPLNTGDQWNNTYVAILEPLDVNGTELIIASPKAQFNAEAKQAVQAARAPSSRKAARGLGTVTLKAEIGDVVEEANRWIVQAAIDGANEQLVPYDDVFAAIFEDVVADNPLLVTSDNGDYYLVPFAQSYKDSIEDIDAMIATLEAMKAQVPAAHETAIQAAIDELESLRNELNIDRTEIMVVIIVDAADGHFKEAAWVLEPVEYLPTTEEEALEIVGKPGATAELVYTGLCPYYPDWKVTDGCSVYYVNQLGELYDADSDCDGYLISEGDCNDDNAAVNPGATEVCDGVDNNCDGVVDEGCPTEPSVIDYGSYADWACEQDPSSWYCDLGWSNVDNALVRDDVCAVAETDGDAYITLDMGETKNSGTITVRCASGHGEGPYFDGTTTVYGSADNANWNVLGTFDIPDDGWDLTDYTVPFSSQQVRYVKVKLIIAECGTNWDIDSITW